MLDPYQVLGVGKYDEDQVVKKAYRQLSKQYHPDNNLNNPNKEAAEETFKKIQQAYEQIMHERSIGIGGPDDLKRNYNRSNGSGYTSGSAGNGGSGYSYGSNGNNGAGYTAGSGGYYSSGNSSGSGWNNRNNTQTKERYTSGFWNNTGFYSGNNYNNNSNTTNNNYNNYNNYENSNGYNGNNDSYDGYYSGQNTQAYYNEDAEGMLGTVANKLNNRKFFEAWDILNSMNTRNDVWYYYSAIANLGLGNSITALNHVRTAKAMQPGRPEYDELISGIQSGTIHYQGKSEMFVPQKSNSGNTCLKIGIAMIAMNIFCGGGGVMIPICFSCI